MSYSIAQNRRAQNNNPTHRNETIHIGAVYLNLPNDVAKVTTETVDLLCAFNNALFLELQDRTHILPSINGGQDTLESLTEAIISGDIVHIYSGGTDGVLGLDKIVERGAHDYVHFLAQCDFTLAGEYKAFIKTAELLDMYGSSRGASPAAIKQAIQVAYSEIYLQAAAWDFLGDYPSEQKIILLHTPYNLNRCAISSKSKPSYAG
jgi:hypothetical protein